VVYTGGFASAGVVDVVRTLLVLLPASVPYYHWGDIDPGGIRIFRFLEETLPRPPRPHSMDQCLAESHGKPGEPDGTLKSIAASDSAVAGLAEWLWKGPNVRHLEQEALDPLSPLSGGSGR
jgi:Wadjet anti plasmid transformation system JetA-like protein